MIRHDWLKKGFACSLLLGGVVSYQNCGGKFSVSGVITQSSSANFNVAAATIAYHSSADVAWAMKSSSMPEVNRFGRATRWLDYKKSGLNLYPPLLPNTQTLNVDASGLVEQFNGTDYLTFQPNASMTVAVADVGQFVFDDVTILMVFTNLQLPTATGGTIRLFSLLPSNGDVAGELVIDATASANGGVDFVMTDWFDQNNYNQLKMNLTTDQLKSPVAIAARFDKDGSKMGLSINGQITDSKITVKGAVSGLGLVARTFTLHAASGTFGSDGTFSLGDFLMYHQSFDDAHLQTASSTLSLAWSGVTTAPISTPATPTPSPTPATQAPANGAALYTTNCASCHGPLATSTRHGVVLAQIDSAIANVAAMSALTNLSESDRQAIADALQ